MVKILENNWAARCNTGLHVAGPARGLGELQGFAASDGFDAGRRQPCRASAHVRGLQEPLVAAAPLLDRQALRALVGTMAEQVTQATSWPCDVQNLKIRRVSAHEAVRLVSASFGDGVGETSWLAPLVQKVWARRMQACLIPHTNTLFVVDRGSAAGRDALGGAILRQMVRLAQHQKFPQFVAEMDELIARAPQRERDINKARLADRLLFSESHAEFVAHRLREELFPCEDRISESFLAQFFVDMVSKIMDWLHGNRRGTQQGVAALAAMATTRLDPASSRLLVGQNAIDFAFDHPIVAEYLAYGRTQYPVKVPYDASHQFWEEVIDDYTGFNFFRRSVDWQYEFPNGTKIDARIDPIGAARQHDDAGHGELGVVLLQNAWNRENRIEYAEAGARMAYYCGQAEESEFFSKALLEKDPTNATAQALLKRLDVRDYGRDA